MNEQNIENKIRYIIDRKKHGVILFAGDFADMGERKTINKAFQLQLSVYSIVVVTVVPRLLSSRIIPRKLSVSVSWAVLAHFSVR